MLDPGCWLDVVPSIGGLGAAGCTYEGRIVKAWYRVVDWVLRPERGVGYYDSGGQGLR
jgi:hypothetical protein